LGVHSIIVLTVHIIGETQEPLMPFGGITWLIFRVQTLKMLFAIIIS
jgi:hypothetical protein